MPHTRGGMQMTDAPLPQGHDLAGDNVKAGQAPVFGPPVDKIGPRRYPLFHTIKRILVLKARDRAVIVRASRAQ
jgi:hypothetical protein